MKIQNVLSLSAGLCIFASLTSAYYYGQNKQPYHYKTVKFCPETANIKKRLHYKDYEKSQQELDTKYCKYSYKLLASVWEDELFNDPIPVNTEALQIKDIYPLKNTNIYLLIAPFLAFTAYLFWDRKCQIDSETAFSNLESHKVKIKAEGLIARADRNLKTADVARASEYHTSLINREADSKLIAEGFLSIEQMRELSKCASEIEQQRHGNNLLQYQVADSLGKKQIAENLRDARDANNKFTVAPEPTPEGKDDKFKQLTENLKQHEGGWLWEVITSTKPVWIVGGQGSGKSSLAAAIVLCRHHLLGQKLKLICDAHGQKNRTKAWKHLIPLECEVVGERNNYEALATAMDEAVQRWCLRTEDDGPIQSLWDELTQLSLQPECVDEVKKFVRHSLTDVRKSNEYLVCIAHAFTNAATGNAEGFKELRDQETIQIKRKSKNGRQPLPHAELSGMYDDGGSLILEQPVTIPDWLYPDKLVI